VAERKTRGVPQSPASLGSIPRPGLHHFSNAGPLSMPAFRAFGALDACGWLEASHITKRRAYRACGAEICATLIPPAERGPSSRRRASASSRLLRLLLLQNLDTFPGVTPARLTEKHPVAGFSAKGLDFSGKACRARAVLAGNLVRHVGALWEGRPPGGRSFLHQENKRPAG
jgi:hypothetical protein